MPNIVPTSLTDNVYVCVQYIYSVNNTLADGTSEFSKHKNMSHKGGNSSMAVGFNYIGLHRHS